MKALGWALAVVALVLFLMGADTWLGWVAGALMWTAAFVVKVAYQHDVARCSIDEAMDLFDAERQTARR